MSDPHKVPLESEPPPTVDYLTASQPKKKARALYALCAAICWLTGFITSFAAIAGIIMYVLKVPHAGGIVVIIMTILISVFIFIAAWYFTSKA